MNEAERYLERELKAKGALPSAPEYPGRQKKGNQADVTKANKPVNPKADTNWSIAFAVLGVVAAACWMLFFKSCSARF